MAQRTDDFDALRVGMKAGADWRLDQEQQFLVDLIRRQAGYLDATAPGHELVPILRSLRALVQRADETAVIRAMNDGRTVEPEEPYGLRSMREQAT